MRIVFSIYLVLLANFLFAQPTSDEQLATHYFQSGDFEKAALYYEKLYLKNPSELNYDFLLKSFLELKEFEKARKHVKSRIKLSKSLKYTIDFGMVYEREENIKKATEAYEKVIKELPEDASQILQVSNLFLLYKKQDWALQTLLKGRKILRDVYPFNIDIAEIYEAQGKQEEMVREYLDLIGINEAYLPSVQSSLNNSQGFQKGSSQNQILKRELVKYIQKYTDRKIYTELLIWLYVQEQNFSMALTQAKALDKRMNESGERVMQIAQQAYSNEVYESAIEGYEYVINRLPVSPYALDAKAEILSVRKDKILKTNTFTQQELLVLDQAYTQTLKEIENTPEYIDVLRDQCMIKALYMHSLDEPIASLTHWLAQNKGDAKKNAHCKLDLGDYLVLKNEIWEASLYYSQVDKDFKYDELGEQAKFKNAKISFYTGDFNWAKAQLDVLKGSTSKLIANDALWLSVLITDNTTIDTNQKPLQMYAQAELYIIQNQLDIANATLDSIGLLFPDNSLEDDIWFLKYRMALQTKQFEIAISFLEKIISKYPTEILGDDAVYAMAQMYDFSLVDKEKAMLYYQKILEEYSGSMWGVEARKRYRILRGDSIN